MYKLSHCSLLQVYRNNYLVFYQYNHRQIGQRYRSSDGSVLCIHDSHLHGFGNRLAGHLKSVRISFFFWTFLELGRFLFSLLTVEQNGQQLCLFFRSCRNPSQLGLLLSYPLLGRYSSFIHNALAGSDWYLTVRGKMLAILDNFYLYRRVWLLFCWSEDSFRIRNHKNKLQFTYARQMRELIISLLDNHGVLALRMRTE